jgi:superfamily I DNA/RNA helicase/RecB family exonuclease
MAVLKSTPSLSPFEADERQSEAILHDHGPMLVVAGAGTGKTTVLIRRIARLIREKHARPDEILAVTYTENAAREMRERVEAELRGIDVSALQVKTFHAYCNELLIRNGKGFGVLEDCDLWIYLRRRIRELGLNYFVRAANVSQFLHDLLDFLRRCQDELITPEKYADYVRRLESGELPIPRVSKPNDQLRDDEVLGRCKEIASVFATVERMLQEDNLGTFGHMITKAHDLLQQHESILAHERDHSRFILVDEFQDVNFAQVKIVRNLAGTGKNVFAVGDPDQAIYRFRGASSAAFGLFQHQFPSARMVVLEKNRRSTTPILRTAFALISENPPVFGQASLDYERVPLVSAREESAKKQGIDLPSPPVDAAVLTQKEVESADLISTIRQKRRSLRNNWKDFAVLYRIQSHREQLVSDLADEQIPFTIENMDVLDTPEVRDLFACLRATVSPSDAASLFRVAALPQFAIRGETLRAAMQSIPKNSTGASVATVLARIEGGEAVLEVLKRTRDEISPPDMKCDAALEIIVRRFALNRTSRPVVAVFEFVGKWQKKSITDAGNVVEFLEYMEYFPDAHGVISLAATDEDAIRLMTAHAAKGLEFDHVFILRANSSSFPCSYKEPLVEFPPELRDPDSVAESEGKVLHEQEERRLFYVAMTRARDSLTLYAQQGRGKDPTPAGFLRNLLGNSSLGRWLRPRNARALQAEIFAEEAALSRVNAWLAMAPVLDLNSRLSATAVESYSKCPLQFKLEREWHIPRKVPAAIHYGAAIHTVLRSYYDSIRRGRPIPDPDLIELFRTNLADAHIEERYQHDLYEAQGVQQLTDFLAVAHATPVPDVLHTEEPFEVRIGDAVVVGRIDRVDALANDRVAIIDYKTGKPRTQDNTDKSLQLSIYAIAAREKWGYETGRLIFYNLAENRGVVTTRDQSALKKAKSTIEQVVEDIAAKKFDPKPGFHCGFCPYRNLCPATEKRLYSPIAAKGATTRN